ncbi:MAG: hypothetical protein ACP5UQ_09500 [Anaerolineae bacterium]
MRDLETGDHLRTLAGNEDAVLALAFRPVHEHLLAGGSHSEPVRVWDVATGAVVQEIRSSRPYDDLDITDVAGLTDAEVRTLKPLGAVERQATPTRRVRPSAYRDGA